MSALTYAGVNLAVLAERLLSIAQQYQGGSGDLGQSLSYGVDEDVVVTDQAPDRGVQGYGSEAGLPLRALFVNEVNDLSEPADSGCKCPRFVAAHNSSSLVTGGTPTVGEPSTVPLPPVAVAPGGATQESGGSNAKEHPPGP